MATFSGTTILMWRRSALWHAGAAALVLVLLVALVAHAYASASYRERAGRWLTAVGLLALLATLYGTGAGLSPGEAGAEARAHAGAALGLEPLAVTTMAFAHALAGLLFVLLVLAWAAPYLRSGSLSRRQGLGALAVAVLLPLAFFGLMPQTAPAPEVVDAEAARAPWVLRALEPLESALGVPLAMGVGAVVLLLLAFLPLIDRRPRSPWPRRVATLAMVSVFAGYVALALYSGLTPPAEHLHAAVEEVGA